MRPVHAIILIAPLLLAGQCSSPQMPVSEACKVLKATLWSDGQFMFVDSEIDALREVNQIKIVAVKNFYKRCPK